MTAPLRRHYRHGAATRDVEVSRLGSRLHGVIDGRVVDFDAKLLARNGSGAEIAVLLDDGRHRAIVVRSGDVVHVHVDGRAWRLGVVAPRAGGDTTAPLDDGEDFVASPMTGVVRKMFAKPGAAVASGQTLFVVEAMKMEFAVPAPRDVVIDAVRAAEGDRVEIQQVIVTFRKAGGS